MTGRRLYQGFWVVSEWAQSLPRAWAALPGPSIQCSLFFGSESICRRSITVTRLFVCLLIASLAAFALPNNAAAAADCTDRACLPATPAGEAVAAGQPAHIPPIDNGAPRSFLVGLRAHL